MFLRYKYIRILTQEEYGRFKHHIGTDTFQHKQHANMGIQCKQAN